MYVLWGALREDNVCSFISSIDHHITILIHNPKKPNLEAFLAFKPK